MARGPANQRRWRLMSGLCRTAGHGFGWMIDPIHNACTRLAVVQNAATGQLLVRGWEQDGVATEASDLAARLADPHGVREIAQIGTAACRERGCKNVAISGVEVTLQKQRQY